MERTQQLRALAAFAGTLVSFLVPTPWLRANLSITPIPGDLMPPSGL